MSEDVRMNYVLELIGPRVPKFSTKITIPRQLEFITPRLISSRPLNLRRKSFVTKDASLGMILVPLNCSFHPSKGTV